jgi:hypothetical protein
MKPALKYFEPTDKQREAELWIDVVDRRDFLFAHDDLSIEELIRESNGQMIKLFLWFGGLSTNDKNRIWPKLDAALTKLDAQRLRNAVRAQRMIEQHPERQSKGAN